MSGVLINAMWPVQPPPKPGFKIKITGNVWECACGKSGVIGRSELATPPYHTCAKPTERITAPIFAVQPPPEAEETEQLGDLEYCICGCGLTRGEVRKRGGHSRR